MSRPAFPSSGRRSSRFPGFGGSCRASSISAASAVSRLSGCHRSTSTPGGTSWTRGTGPQTSREHLPDVGRPDERRPRLLERLPPPRTEIGSAPHRVLELRAVRLDGERLPRGDADGAAEQHVVREHEVGGREGAHRRRVRLDPPFELLARAVGYPPHLVSRVAVEHEDGQKPGDVRPHRRRTAEVIVAGPCLLAEHGHVVPGTAPFARELARVDVRAGAAEQVPVPEQDAHDAHPAPCRRATRPAARTARMRAGSGPVVSSRHRHRALVPSSADPLRRPSRDGRSCEIDGTTAVSRSRWLARRRGRSPATSARARSRPFAGRQAASWCRCARASWSS